VSEANVSIDPYRVLAELADAELALCRAGRPEEMAPLYEEGGRIAATLPSRPPEEAAPWLRRAATVQTQITALLDGVLAGASEDFQRLHLQREAARSYAAAADARARV